MIDKDAILFFLLTGKAINPNLYKSFDSYIKMKNNKVSLMLFNDDIELEITKQRRFLPY